MARGLGENLILGFFAAALFLDIPSARAYNEYEAWTEGLGTLLFHSLKEWSFLPLPFTLFELMTYACAGFFIWRWGWQRVRLWTFALALGSLIPASAAYAFFLGVLRGQDYDLALTQLHFIPLLGAWSVIGYVIGLRPEFLLRCLRWLFYICLWRSFFALWIFYTAYDGNMNRREFLIDHASSSFFVLAMLYSLAQAFWHRHRLAGLLFYSSSFALMLSPYLLNDRRTSFVGIIAFLLALPLALPRRVYHSLRWFFYGFMSILALAILWQWQNQSGSNLGSALRVLAQSETERLDYRQIENFNLMLSVIDKPSLGQGFGKLFIEALALPDISFAFDLYRAIPHNSALFLWAFAGPLGIAALMSVSSAAFLLVTQCGRQARSKAECLLSVVALALLLQWLMYVFFDMGLFESRLSMLFGVFIAGLCPLYGRQLLERWHAKSQLF